MEQTEIETNAHMQTLICMHWQKHGDFQRARSVVCLLCSCFCWVYLKQAEEETRTLPFSNEHLISSSQSHGDTKCEHGIDARSSSQMSCMQIKSRHTFVYTQRHIYASSAPAQRVEVMQLQLIQTRDSDGSMTSTSFVVVFLLSALLPTRIMMHR